MQKRRRNEGGFPGAGRIQAELANGPRRKRVGIRPDGRAPAREGTQILAPPGDHLGVITSGGFGPSVGAPIAMGYVAADRAGVGLAVNLMVRGKALAAAIAPLPFIPHRYARNR
jgi:aminomethyltransferase